MQKIALSVLIGAYSVLGAVVWSAPEDISPGTANVFFSPFPLVVDSNSNATAAWMQFTMANNVIATATKPFENPWAPFPPTELTSSAANAYQPALGIDSSGNITAIWGRNINTIQTAYRPQNTGVWSAVTDVRSGVTAFDPDIAVSQTDDAVAVWYEAFMGNDVIFSRARIGGVWSMSNLQVSTAGFDSQLPRIGADAIGNTVLIWLEDDGMNDIVRGATLTAGGGAWANFATLSAGGAGAQNPQIAVDPMGNAVAVWEWFDSMTMTNVIQSADFNFGAMSWSSTTTISDPTDDSFTPQVSVNSDGTAIAIWDSISNGIQTSTKPLGSLWEPILSIPGSSGNDPDIAIDAAGTAVAVWSQFTGGADRISASERLATGSWSTPQIISDPVMVGNALGPTVSVNASGYAVAVWRKDVAGIFFAQSATADISITTGPGSIRGKKLLNQFPFQNEYFNHLVWTPSTTTDLIGYRVYRNGELIASLPANQNSYEDHLRLKNGVDTYGVTAVDTNDDESDPVTITIQ